MAGKQPQHAATKAAIKAVAKEVVKEENKQQQRKQKWQPRKKQGKTKWFNKNQVKHEVKTELKRKGLEGPRTKFTVKVSATIGKIGPNVNAGPELQISTFMHPALMKEPNDGTNFGPLQAAAAQWGLWRLSDLKIQFTPLVGASALTGSMYRASLNLTQSPGSTSWGGLGARKHLDIPVGVSRVWHLRKGDLAGPRETWWLTDTNEEGGQSCGPMLEIHGLGKTTSTYRDAPWQGDLFVVEVTGVWQFTNYNAKPALGTLNRVVEETNASIEVGADGVMKMTIPSTSRLARHMSEQCERTSSAASQIGETIWQVVDQGAGLVASVAPEPFGWLIKGGWWFVKKILGRANTGDEVYYVYASLADAQNNKPVEANQFNKQSHNTTLAVTQINAPNTGPNNAPAVVTSRLFPIPQAGIPDGWFWISGHFESLHMVGLNGTNGSSLPCGIITTFPQWEFKLKKGATEWGCAMQGVASSPDNVTCWSVDSDYQLKGWYDIAGIPSTGIVVDWVTGSNQTVHLDWADVLAWRSDEWGTLRLTYWLCRTRREVTASDFDTTQRNPSPYITNAEAQKYKADVREVWIPTVVTNEQRTNSRVQYISRVRAGTIVVLWCLGSHTFESGTGKGTIVSKDNYGAYGQLPTKMSTTGLWHRALSTVGPSTDWLTVAFDAHAAVTSDDIVTKLLAEIENKYDLEPRRQRSRDHNRDLTRLKLYEALRDADWEHLPAEGMSSVLQ
nr:capsid protein [Human astrovirus]